MRKLVKIAICILAVFVIIAGIGIFYLTRGLETAKNTAINEINPSKISDGTYEGKYSYGRWTNELIVTVKDNKITDIKVMKDVTFPKPEWTKLLFDRVILKQSTKVDVVSGATATSKAYLKSIEDALGQ